MLFDSLVAAVFATGLLPSVIAGPISNGYVTARAKREVPSSHRLHERQLAHLSSQWTKRSKVPENHVLPMRIGLKQRNLEAGHDKLMDM